ncbi:MAG: cytidylate kinase-like family protein [Desulfofustis sp.]|nr:cytidylate kinase-like family protein [Desulfofustis sp.]NNK58756.1 cytidylate kinase-like family protein [Desulfofustis sp.]
MSIICISRGSYYRGKDVAERVADILGYHCVSRDSLLAASDEFDIPEIKLTRNIQHATQILERYSFGRERYMNFICAEILKRLKQDNHVYHGLAGQFFVKDISHLLRIRIIADLDERVTAEAERENISPDKARMQLKHDDEERQKWALFLYGVDIADPALYDMTVNVSAMGVEDSAELIAQTATLPCYQATRKSQRSILDQALAAEIRAALFDFPQAGVSTREGRAYVNVKAPEEQTETIRARIESAVGGIIDLAMVEIRVDPFY